MPNQMPENSPRLATDWQCFTGSRGPNIWVTPSDSTCEEKKPSKTERHSASFATKPRNGVIRLESWSNDIIRVGGASAARRLPKTVRRAPRSTIVVKLVNGRTGHLTKPFAKGTVAPRSTWISQDKLATVGVRKCTSFLLATIGRTKKLDLI